MAPPSVHLRPLAPAFKGAATIGTVLGLIVLAGCPLRFAPCSPQQCPQDQVCASNGACVDASAHDAGARIDAGAPIDDAGPARDGGIDGGLDSGAPPLDAGDDAGEFIPDAGDAGGPIDAGPPPCIDLDDDGYGEGCALGPDCDDNNPVIFIEQVLFVDDDGDGVGAGDAAIISCLGIDFPTRLAPLRGDCDDADPDRFHWRELFADVDQDGLTAIDASRQCVGDTLPPGFLETPPAPDDADCDDNNARRGRSFHEVCDGVDNNCNGQIDENGACDATDCDVVVNQATNATYLHCNDPRNFADNETRCLEVGYEPASLETHTELNFASSLAADAPNDIGYELNGVRRAMFIGLNDRADEGVFVWPSGHPVHMGPFVGDTNPDNLFDEDCVEILSENRGMNDALCSAGRTMLCEPQGIVERNPLTWPPRQPPPTNCIDDDGDGFGPGCPAGPDCAPNDPDRFRFYPSDVDDDGDGFFRPTKVNVCGGRHPPLPFDSPPPVDCNDDDERIGGEVTYYLDADDDGVPGPNALTALCREEVPPPDAIIGATVFDCDDDNAQIFPGQAEACDQIDNNCDGFVDEDACFCETKFFEGKSFLFCDDRFGAVDNQPQDRAGLDEAQQRCAQQGGRTVVVPDSEAEKDFLRENTASSATFSWLGLLYLTDTGEWRETDGTVVDDETDPPDPWPTQPYTFWGSGEPNGGAGQPCAVFRNGNGRWADVACTRNDASTICE